MDAQDYKILAVDDSPSMRSMISFTLKRAGYESYAADDGVTGLEAAQNGDYDLVITDINMPNMDGITLIEHLRQLDNYKHKPILVLTTESGNDIKQQGKNAGATGWIVKPFDPDKLLSALGQVLG